VAYGIAFFGRPVTCFQVKVFARILFTKILSHLHGPVFRTNLRIKSCTESI
jgi:hypothetical protein